MKIAYTLLLSIFFIGYLHGQGSRVVDSLKQLYEKEKDAVQRLELLASICAEEPSTVDRLSYAEELLSLARAQKIPGYVHAAYLQKAIGLRLQGDLSNSLQNLFKSAETARQIEDKKMLGQSYGEIANTFSAQGDLQNGTNYMNKALNIFREIGDSINLAVGLLNTGYDYYTLENFFFQAEDGIRAYE